MRNHENGTNGIPAKVAEAYGRVLKTDPARYLIRDEARSLTSGAVPTGRALREVPVIGEVRAGMFQAVRSDIEEWHEREGDDTVAIDLPQFERAHLVAYRVVGRSMDKEYPEGTRVVVCPAAEIGVRAGDHVIVQRPGPGGVEITIKEVVLEPGGVVALWPRSTDPAYQSPIRIRPEQHADSGPRVVGVVVAAVRVRPAQQGPLIRFTDE